MTRQRWMVTGLAGAVVFVGGLLAVQAFAAGGGHGHKGHEPAEGLKKAGMKDHGRRIHQKFSADLAKALKALDTATRAVESGDKDKALTQLTEARKLVAVTHKAMVLLAKPRFANVKCPMMENPIDPTNVPAKLTRTLKGQRIAFCCAGCPKEWDKLSDAEKQVRLAKVVPSKHHRVNKPKQEAGHQGHNH